MTSRCGWPRIDPVFRRRGKRPRARTPGSERPLPACVSLRRLSLRNPSAVFPDRPHGKTVLSGPPASPSLIGCFSGLFLTARDQLLADLKRLNAISQIIYVTPTSLQLESFEMKQVIGITFYRRTAQDSFGVSPNKLISEAVAPRHDRSKPVSAWIDWLSRQCPVSLARAPWRGHSVYEWAVRLRSRGFLE